MTHISQPDSNWRDWLFAELFAHIFPAQTDNRILDKRILIDLYFYQNPAVLMVQCIRRAADYNDNKQNAGLCQMYVHFIDVFYKTLKYMDAEGC